MTGTNVLVASLNNCIARHVQCCRVLFIKKKVWHWQKNKKSTSWKAFENWANWLIFNAPPLALPSMRMSVTAGGGLALALASRFVELISNRDAKSFEMHVGCCLDSLAFKFDRCSNTNSQSYTDKLFILVLTGYRVTMTSRQSSSSFFQGYAGATHCSTRETTVENLNLIWSRVLLYSFRNVLLFLYLMKLMIRLVL